MITGYADVRDAVRTVREGLFDYLTKPFENIDVLETSIDKALNFDRARREIVMLRQHLDGRDRGHKLTGRSPAIETLLQQIRQIAAPDTPSCCREKAAAARTWWRRSSMPAAHEQRVPSSK